MRLKVCLIVVAFAASVNAEDVPNFALDGKMLSHPRIERFDGSIFYVSHDGGLAKVLWEKMPEAYRAKHPLDPSRSAQAKTQLEKANLARIDREEEAARILKLARVLVIGKVARKLGNGFCVVADGSHCDAPFIETFHKDTLVHVGVVPFTENWQVDYPVIFFARRDGMFQFTDERGAQMSVINVIAPEFGPNTLRIARFGYGWGMDRNGKWNEIKDVPGVVGPVPRR